MYSDEFIELIYSMWGNGDYVGHGNPNAKVLFLGQEPAWDKRKDKDHYKEEIANNCDDWINIVKTGFGFKNVDPSVSAYSSPLNPWPNQKFQIYTKRKNGIVTGKDGTARTWYIYQKILNELYGKKLDREDYLTLHQLSFHTDMSSEASKRHGDRGKDSSDSVRLRKIFLSRDFFRKFPVAIAAVGNFPKESYGDKYFKDVFDVDYKGNQASEGMPWINVNVREGKNPQLLIHCQQVTARKLRDAYFHRIVEIIKKFINDYNVDLTPTI